MVGKKLRLNNMPGVVAWLEHLRENGPSKRQEGRSGASARAWGLTDYWVRHKGLGKWMRLEQLKAREAGNPLWWQLVDYGDRREVLTPEGRRVLETFLTQVN